MRGLLVIEPLYHQIVAGNKTQTRRSGGLELVNGRKATKKKPAIITNPDEWEKAAPVRYGNGDFVSQYFVKAGCGLIAYVNAKDECKPRYKIGEVLYLKEPIFIDDLGFRPLGTPPTIYYKFNGKHSSNFKWQNKLFMPAAAARAFIRITGIRCERLMDIRDRDCTAEGIELYPLPGQATLTYTDYLCKGLQNHVVTPKESFLSLYKFANKVKEVPNLWVFCYNFEYLPNYNSNA